MLASVACLLLSVYSLGLAGLACLGLETRVGRSVQLNARLVKEFLWRWGGGYLSISSATFALSMVNVFTLFLFCVPLFPYVLFVRSCIHTFTYSQETQLVILKLVNSGGG